MSSISAHRTVLRVCVAEGLRLICGSVEVEDDAAIGVGIANQEVWCDPFCSAHHIKILRACWVTHVGSGA